jgi:hypothetical protein
MNKIFIEYLISVANRERYLTYIKKKKSYIHQLEIYESAERTGLFLEIWNESAEGEWSEDVILDDHIASWIDGGKERRNVWRFKPIGFNHLA